MYTEQHQTKESYKLINSTVVPILYIFVMHVNALAYYVRVQFPHATDDWYRGVCGVNTNISPDSFQCVASAGLMKEFRNYLFSLTEVISLCFYYLTNSCVIISGFHRALLESITFIVRLMHSNI